MGRLTVTSEGGWPPSDTHLLASARPRFQARLQHGAPGLDLTALGSLRLPSGVV